MMKTKLLIAQIPSAEKKTTEIRRKQTEEIRRRLLETGLREAGISPAEADRIERSPDGKPRLSGYPDFHFNLSHSGNYVACVFSPYEIGLDLQEHRPPAGRADNYLRIARRFFTDREYAALQALQAQQAPEAGPAWDPVRQEDPGTHFPLQEDPDRHSSLQKGPDGHSSLQKGPDGYSSPPAGSDRNTSCQEDPVIRLFSRLWVIKEAYLKYIGCGLRGSMDSFYPVPLPELGDCGDPEADSGAVLSGIILPGADPGTVSPEGDSGAVLSGVMLPEADPGTVFAEADSGAVLSGIILPGADPGTVSPGAAFENRQRTIQMTDLPVHRSPAHRSLCVQQFPVRGKIEILKDTALFHPAGYALLPAPEGYSIAVCAKRLPAEICMRIL